MHRSRSASTQSVVTLASGAILAACLVSALHAQEPQSQPSKMPNWQVAAGGKMQFDVASVKLDKLETVRSGANFPLDDGDAYAARGGYLSVKRTALNSFIQFAYKLTLYQSQFLIADLPKWATTDLFDAEARAEGNPSKDQMRLMMQSLLQERFKMAVHFETRQLPTFNLVLAKQGKLGPQLVSHSGNPPCVPGTAGAGPPQQADVLPCGFLGGKPTSDGLEHTGSRRVTMQQIANDLYWLGALDRPVVDRTGLSGGFDFAMQYKLELNGPQPNPQPEPSGPTFLEALKEQLGLKLEPDNGPVEILVVDHVEEPSEN